MKDPGDQERWGQTRDRRRRLSHQERGREAHLGSASNQMTSLLETLEDSGKRTHSFSHVSFLLIYLFHLT